MTRSCDNPATGKKDWGLGVQTGDIAPKFSLPSTRDPNVIVSLDDLLDEAPYVLLQFGAYT